MTSILGRLQMIGVIAALVLISGCTSDSPTSGAQEQSPQASTFSTATAQFNEEAQPPTTVATTSSSPSAESSPDPTQPDQENAWIPVDAQLLTPDNVWSFDQAPEGFQEYASSVVTDVDEEGCTTEIEVYAVHPDGWVYGTLSSGGNCGGGAWVIWTDRDGEWTDLIGMQDTLDCTRFSNEGVPEGTGQLQCFDDGEFRDY